MTVNDLELSTGMFEKIAKNTIWVELFEFLLRKGAKLNTSGLILMLLT